jgi:hypothetical protein
MNLKSLFIVFSCSFFLALSAVPTFASTYSFSAITSTNTDNVDIAESQIAVDVTAVDTDKVSFKFTNSIGEACSITDVYFDDGSLLGISEIVPSDEEVDFSALANPAEFPAAKDADPDFETTVGFSVDSNSPAPANGVDHSDEWLQIIFDLQDSRVFMDVIDDLADGSLRVGIHVGVFEILGSEGQTISESN